MLRKITEEQEAKLISCGIDANSDMLVLEVLKLIRAGIVTRNDYLNYYVNIHRSTYFVAEVSGIGQEKSWYSHGVHDWEDAESLALDYILRNEEGSIKRSKNKAF